MWKLICEMGGNMRVKSLDAYDIKNDIADVNSKEILMQSNNIIYEKIKSRFKINPKDFGLHINNYTNEKDEYLESLEIGSIIKKRASNKNESTKMIAQSEMFNYLENRLKSSKM